MSPRRTVTSTYRLQLHPGFGFADAQALVPYLARLGISHLYLSPVLEAVPGSTHGYDVVDPGRVRDALGGESGLRALADTAHEAGLGLVLDIVPNHVALVSPHNPWWWDVLACGPDSRFGRHFDIFWRTGSHGQPTVLVPELAGPLSEQVAEGLVRLEHTDRGPRPGWRVVHHEHEWPVSQGSLKAAGFDEHDVPGSIERARADSSALLELLEHQYYRLASWRRANDELEHRRFFDISSLGAVRIEDPEVFADAHAVVLPLVADGVIDGLRIDHVDGLADPVGYLRRLRDAVGADPWIIVEKILTAGERFRHDWPVDGTVGYEFADLALGVHVDLRAAEVFDSLQATLTGGHVDHDAAKEHAKRSSLAALFGAERARLAQALLAAAPELDPVVASDVLDELVVAWPVYRTYVRPEDAELHADDRGVIALSAAHVRARRPELGETVDRVAALLLLEERSREADVFLTAFQQLTGPAVAKGVEDTYLYRDTRFVAVNEVGGEPATMGRDLGVLHAANAATWRHRPATMLLSSTHDTKRSEDVRARLAVLSQDVDLWVRTVLELRARSAGITSPGAPTPAHQHLAMQTAVGAWPIDAGRLGDYLVKAAREGKEATNWLDPDDAYEAALRAYATALTDDPDLVELVERTVDVVREPGWITSLSMTLIKLTAPGVPDVYQGCELWDLSLVDPDNRRRVDHDRRARLLAELQDGVAPEQLWERVEEGLAKLAVVHGALRLRARRPGVFADGGYRAMWPRGERAGNLAAFLRGTEVLTMAPVRVRELGRRFADWRWGDTVLELPAGSWRDVFTDRVVAGGEHPVGELLDRFPVALLARMTGKVGR